jgi:hypothetical protein
VPEQTRFFAVRGCDKSKLTRASLAHLTTATWQTQTQTAENTNLAHVLTQEILGGHMHVDVVVNQIVMATLLVCFEWFLQHSMDYYATQIA